MRHRCPQWPAWAGPGSINIQKGQKTMENSFFKDAINRIVGWRPPSPWKRARGHQFCSANLRERSNSEVELPARYSVDTLEALVKADPHRGRRPGIAAVCACGQRPAGRGGYTYTHKDYAVYSRLPLYEANERCAEHFRQPIASAREGRYGAAKPVYAVTEDRDYLLALLSRIDVNQGVSSVGQRNQSGGQRPAPARC